MASPRSTRPRAGQRTTPRSTPLQKPRPQAQPFNLDALERDGDPGEFRFTLNGREFVLADPYDTEWQDTQRIMELASSSDLGALMQRLLGDQYEDFAAIHVPIWKLDMLAREWAEHFGVGEGIA
jgi:hypothetical protein